MLLAFVLGLILVLTAITVLSIVLMCAKWLKNYISEKLRQKKNHKVAFADTREIVDEYLKEKAEDADEISLDELERMCEKTPFVAAYVNEETGEIFDYEGIKADKVDSSFKAKMKQQAGMLIFE